jgi:Predicted metal binding domain
MKIDARVSKLKFEQEIGRLDAQSETLKKHGIVVQKILFPFVEAIFIPRSNLKLQLPVELPPGATLPQLPPGIILPPGAKMQFLTAIDIPSLAARAFGVKISLEDFDQRAPSVVFCDPFTWEELPYEKLHRGNHIGDNGTAFNVILGGHPLTKKPFLCMRGIREYHEHPQHTGDDWMQYRKHVGLFSTLDTIWKTCVLNANPNLILQPPNIQVNWAPAGAK